MTHDQSFTRLFGKWPFTINYLVKFGGKGLVEVEIFRDHVDKGSCDFVNGGP